MLIPAIHFPGTCAAAIAYYEKVFGAKIVSIAYNKEAPAGAPIQAVVEHPNRVMHAELIIAGTSMNMGDVSEDVIAGNMYLFNIFFDTADEVIDAYNQLCVDGHVITALGPQFWTAMYADVIDQFGVHWQLMAK